MIAAKLPPNSTVLDQGQGQANWKPATPVYPVSLADWEKPISLDSWPGHIISASSKTQWENYAPIQKVLYLSNGTVKIIHSFLWSSSLEIHKNRWTGGHRALPELMDYQDRRKHPVAVRSADLEETNWRK